MNSELRDAIDALIRCAFRAESRLGNLGPDCSTKRVFEEIDDTIPCLDRAAADVRRQLDINDLRRYEAEAKTRGNAALLDRWLQQLDPGEKGRVFTDHLLAEAAER
jgi:hypothetical protein